MSDSTNAIVRFVNCFGETNYGIVIDADPGGMVQVHWDTFAELLERLEKRGGVTDFVRTGLSVRKSWVRAPDNGMGGSRTELLPIDTPVNWSCAELRIVQAHRRGQG